MGEKQRWVEFLVPIELFRDGAQSPWGFRFEIKIYFNENLVVKFNSIILKILKIKAFSQFFSVFLQTERRL